MKKILFSISAMAIFISQNASATGLVNFRVVCTPKSEPSIAYQITKYTVTAPPMKPDLVGHASSYLSVEVFRKGNLENNVELGTAGSIEQSTTGYSSVLPDRKGLLTNFVHLYTEPNAKWGFLHLSVNNGNSITTNGGLEAICVSKK